MVTIRHSALSGFLVICLAAIDPCAAVSQDTGTERNLAGLKRLHAVAVVVRNNAPREFIAAREWGERVETALRRAIPGLEISDVEHAEARIEVTVMATESGSYLEVSVQRWTRVVDSGENTLSKVWWDSELEIGKISSRALQDSVDSLLKNFAADYARAQSGSGGSH